MRYVRSGGRGCTTMSENLFFSRRFSSGQTEPRAAALHTCSYLRLAVLCHMSDSLLLPFPLCRLKPKSKRHICLPSELRVGASSAAKHARYDPPCARL